MKWWLNKEQEMKKKFNLFKKNYPKEKITMLRYKELKDAKII